jgi:hypothetical protein
LWPRLYFKPLLSKIISSSVNLICVLFTTLGENSVFVTRFLVLGLGQFVPFIIERFVLLFHFVIYAVVYGALNDGP